VNLRLRLITYLHGAGADQPAPAGQADETAAQGETR
jgi:hypothetical protein